MKLWILRPTENLPEGDNPWEPWYDKTFGFVVRAENEQIARQMAHDAGADENRGEFLMKPIAKTKEPWIDARYSTCVELTKDGEAGVVMQDHYSA